MSDRKRPLEDKTIQAALSNKKASLAAMESTNAEKLVFKILCPQTFVGIVIGKAGSVINRIQQDSGSQVKMSRDGEYFPNTMERVILLTGTAESLIKAAQELTTIIAQASDRDRKSADINTSVPNQTGKAPDGTYQMRVLIPKIASGALIGKGGSVVKVMQSASGCKMQLGDGNDPFNTLERPFVINSAEIDKLVLGTVTLMRQLFSETRVRIYENPSVSYPAGGNGVSSAVNGLSAVGGGGAGGGGGMPPQYFSGASATGPPTGTGALPPAASGGSAGQPPVGGMGGPVMMMVGPNGTMVPVSMAQGQNAMGMGPGTYPQTGQLPPGTMVMMMPGTTPATATGAVAGVSVGIPGAGAGGGGRGGGMPPGPPPQQQKQGRTQHQQPQQPQQQQQQQQQLYNMPQQHYQQQYQQQQPQYQQPQYQQPQYQQPQQRQQQQQTTQQQQHNVAMYPPISGGHLQYMGVYGQAGPGGSTIPYGNFPPPK